jgi:hypothetical protein
MEEGERMTTTKLYKDEMVEQIESPHLSLMDIVAIRNRCNEILKVYDEGERR